MIKTEKDLGTDGYDDSNDATDYKDLVLAQMLQTSKQSIARMRMTEVVGDFARCSCLEVDGGE